MKLRTSLAAIGVAAVVAGTTGALALPAAASAHSDTQTLKFVSVTKQSIPLTKTSGAQQDTDVVAGKPVGFDMLYFLFTSGTTGSVSATIDTAGGFIYATFIYHVKTGTITNGTVTGGTGTFAEATGTVKVKNLNQAGTRTAVTITYS